MTDEQKTVVRAQYLADEAFVRRLLAEKGYQYGQDAVENVVTGMQLYREYLQKSISADQEEACESCSLTMGESMAVAMIKAKITDILES